MRPFGVAVTSRSPAELGCDYVVKNDQYTVFIRKIIDSIFGQGLHLSIKRNDREVIRDWRHLQEIKNLICGPHWEAVELFPAESRLIDQANQYHLWCWPYQLPIGDHSGRKIATPDEARAQGAKQRRSK